MKKCSLIRQSLFALILCFAMLLLPSASVHAKVKMSASSAVVEAGSTKTLKVKGTSKKAKWWSSNSAIAAVSSNGKVTTKKAGNANIYARVGGKTLKCKVRVVALSNKEVILPSVGSGATLKAYNGSGTKWKSSAKSIVSVNSKGVITAKKTGIATITCTTRGKKIKCKVYVPSISAPHINLKLNHTVSVRVLNVPYTATFYSDNPSVVSVDATTGVCKGLQRGYATITAVVNGLYGYRCGITVGDSGDIFTPESWISGSTKKSKYTVEINIGNDKTRSYNVFGQGYSSNKFSSNITLYVQNDTVIADPAAPVFDPVIFPVTTKTYKVTSYLGDHGCAACASTTVLSGYAGFQSDPRDFIQTVEMSIFGYPTWDANYSKATGSQMPVSLYGVSKILTTYGISNNYVRSFTSYDEAIAQISDHILKAKPVIIEVRAKNGVTNNSSTRWTGGKHTMVLLGMTDTYKVIVADSADRSDSGFGTQGRIKLVDLSDVCSYIWSSSKTNEKVYYQSESYNGGYILVDN